MVCDLLYFQQKQREDGEEVWTTYRQNWKKAHTPKAAAPEEEEYWEEEYERNSFIDDEAIEVADGDDGEPDQAPSDEDDEPNIPKRRRRFILESSDDDDFEDMIRRVENESTDRDHEDGGQSQVVKLLSDDDEPPAETSGKSINHPPRGSRFGKLRTNKDDLSREVRLKNHAQQHRARASETPVKPTNIHDGDDDDGVVLDMSERVKDVEESRDVEVRLDSTFSMTMGSVVIASKEAVGPEASYEAITLHKEVNDKTAPINLSVPIRLLPAMEKAMDLIHDKIERGGKMPEPEELLQRGDEMGWKFNLEPFHTGLHPKVDIKLDGTFSLLGENIRWQKGTFQVLSFIRHAKHGEKKGKKAFSIGVPWKLFGALRLGIKTFAAVRRAKF